jgi:hypothetical protein
MSLDEYWYGDPSLIYNFQNAFNRRQEYDLTMAWTYGAYFKSALGSTQVWTVQPAKDSDWKKMPKFADQPKFGEEKRELTEQEKQAERNRLYNYYKTIASAKKHSG